MFKSGSTLALGLAILSFAPNIFAQEGKMAAQSLGCTGCHTAETMMVGPPYQAVAKRYDGDEAKILSIIKDNVQNGAKGNWTDMTGGTPMPAQPQAQGKTDKLEALAGWIAGMAQ